MGQSCGVLSKIQIVLFMGISFSVYAAEGKKTFVPSMPPANKNVEQNTIPEIPKEIMEKMKAAQDKYNKMSPEEKKKDYIQKELFLLDQRFQECNMGYDQYKKYNPNGNIEETFWARCRKDYLTEKKKFTDMK